MTRECLICSADISHRSRKAEVCGKACQIKRDGMKRRESGRLRKANMSPEKYAQKKIRAARWRQQYKTWRCVTCNAQVTVGNVYKSGYWCSMTCQLSYWQKGVEASICQTLELKAKMLPSVKVNILKGSWWVAGSCQICNQLFVSRHLDKTCSPECLREKRRPTNKWIDTPTRLAIYDRDAWACHLCSEPVPKNLRWNNDSWQPDYPTLDHIVPRSRGGTDEPDNLRLAHMGCNSLRGDTPLVVPGGVKNLNPQR